MATDSLTTPAPGASAGQDHRGAGWRDELRSSVHWSLAHGLPRLAMRAAARRGDLQGRLMTAASSGDQVWDLLAEIRAAGPLPRARLAYLTVDHAVVREVLASPDFRATPRTRADGMLGRLLDQTAPRVLNPIEPPSLLVTEPPDHTRYRKLVTRVFSVRAVERLRARTEAIAHELLDALDPARRPTWSRPIARCSRSPSSARSSACRPRTGHGCWIWAPARRPASTSGSAGGATARSWPG